MLASPALRRPAAARSALTVLLSGLAILGLAVAGGFVIQHIRGRYAVAVPFVLISSLAVARRPGGAFVGLVLATGCGGLLATYTPFSAGSLADVLLLALWVGVAWSVIAGRTETQATAFLPGAVLVGAYLAVSAVQVLLLGGGGVAFYGFRASQWYLAVVPLMLAATWWTRERYDWAVRAVVVVAAGVGAYATYRYAVGASVRETATVLSNPSGQFEIVNGKVRLFGSFTSSKVLAGWSAQTIPLLIGLAFALHGRWRLAAFGAMALCAIGMFGADVRGAVVAIVPAVGIVLILAQGARGLANVHIGAVIAATAAIGLLGVGAFAYTLGGSQQTQDRYRFVLSDPSKDPSFQGRLVGWKDVWRDVPSHPVGHGVGTTGSSQRRFGRFQSRVVYASDNGYLRVAYEQGTVVLALFVAMLLVLLISIATRAVTIADEIAAGVGVGVVGSIIAAMIYLYTEPWNEGVGWLELWLLVGLALVGLTRRLPAAEARRSVR